MTPSREFRRPHLGRVMRAVLVVSLAAPIALGASALPAAATGGETTTTTLLGAPYTEAYASSFEVTAQVSASGPSQIAAGDGTVTFSDTAGYFSCTSSVNSSGDASCASSTLGPPGSDTITATYSGYQSTFNSSQTTAGLTIDKATTTLSLTTSSPSVGQTATVTATISPNPGGGTVDFTDSDGTTSGCSAVAVTGGSATCMTTTLTTAGSDQVDATFSGNANTDSSNNSTTLIVAKASDTFSISTTGGSVGGTATIVATVSPDPSGGTVSFSDPDGYLSCGAVLVVSGSASCTSGTLSAPGSETVSATYSGDANYTSNGPATTTLTVAQDSTSIALSSNPTAPALGETFTVTATLSPNPGGGTVAFSDQKGYLSGCSSVAVSSGSASCTSSVVTAVGSDQVSASYSGDTDYAASGPSSTTLTLAQATPSISVGASPSSPTVGETATITASLSGPSGAPTPTGTVAFSDTKGFISGCAAVTVVSSAAHCTTSDLTAAETDTIDVSYSGDVNYYSNVGSMLLHISAASTTVTLSANPASPTALSTDLITATVAPTPDGGTVAFSDSAGAISGCSAVTVSAGTASCRTAALSAGTDLVNATYSGDTNYNGSTATTLSLVVAKLATTVTPGVSPNPVTDGQTATVTATISPVPNGGTVAFSDSFGMISGCTSVAVSSGTASCTTGAFSGSGTDVVTAAYSGYGNYAADTNNTSVVVNRIATVAALSFNPTTAVYSQTDTVTATITPNPGSGSVAFSDADGLLPGCGAVAVGSGGTASCTSAALSASGTDQVHASYGGATNYATSSTSATLTIDRAPVFTSSSSATLTAGVASSFAASALGYPAPSFSSSGTLPSGISLTVGGALSGAPAVGSGGTYSVSLIATNSLASATEQLSITVDQVPAFTSPTSATFPYGSFSSFTVAAAPGTFPTPSISESGGLPAGLSYRDNGDGSATLSGTPDNGASGIYPVTFAAQNGAGSATQSFSIDVTGTPTPTTSSPPTTSPAPPSTTTTTATQSLGLSNLAAAVDAGRAGAVASHGSEPSITVKGRLPRQYDPLDTKPTSGRVRLGPSATFPLLGNVGAVGDCTVVTVADIAIADHLAGRLGAVPRFTTAKAIANWHALNGDTADGVTDVRLLDSWDSHKGVLSTHISGWRSLSIANIAELKRAIEADGAIYAGIVVPTNIGSLGNVWNVAIATTTPVSGHALALDGWTAKGFLAVTFGGVVLIPYSWWTSHAESAYAVSLVHAHAPKPSK